MSKSKLREEYEAMFGAVWGSLRLYDDKGNRIYNETSNGYCAKYRFDDNNNVVYYESSKGYWLKYEYDANSNQTYCECSIYGVIKDNRSCSDKVFINEQTGKKFKLTEIK